MVHFGGPVSWAVAVALVLFLCRKVLSSVKLRRAMRRNNCLPLPKYPHKDPFLGLDMFFDQLKAMKDGNSGSVERGRFLKYGKTFEANSWGTKCIHTMDVANVQAVLAQLFDKFGVEPMRLHIGEPFIGKGVFSTDGAYWRHSRELIRPMFARALVTDFTAFDVHLNRMMQRIPRNGSTFDLQALLKLMFLDHSTEMIFGESTKTLLAASPNANGNRLLETFDAGLRGLGKRIVLGRLRILFLWDRSYTRAAHKVHAVIDEYVDKAMARQKEEPGFEKPFTSAVKPYIILDELVNKVQDRAEICNQVLNIFLPARDATGVGLSGVCFLLARHPHVWRKLRAEALSTRGPATYELLRSLTYMRFVLNESFRLLLPANRNMRLCVKDCILPSGGGHNGTAPIYVPRGTQVSVNFGAMQRDKDIWGDDAEDFRPERWENMKPGWHYIPFSGGPRVCPGQQIALTQCAYLLLRLLQNFENIENRDPEAAFVEQSRLTVESRNGVKIALHPS